MGLTCMAATVGLCSPLAVIGGGAAVIGVTAKGLMVLIRAGRDMELAGVDGADDIKRTKVFFASTLTGGTEETIKGVLGISLAKMIPRAIGEFTAGAAKALVDGGVDYVADLEFGWEVDVEIKPQQLTEDMSAIFQGKPGK